MTHAACKRAASSGLALRRCAPARPAATPLRRTLLCARAVAEVATAWPPPLSSSPCPTFVRVDEGDDEDYLTVHPRDDRRTVADALRLHPGLPKAELARVRPVPVCPSRPGRCPTRDDETLALRAPALALGARLPVGGPEGLWLLARLARRDVVLRSEPGDQPVEPALRPVLTSGMLAEVLRHYGAAGLAASDGGRLLSPGVGPLLDDGTYWLGALTPALQVGDLELHNLNVAAAAQRVAAELRALGHSSVRVVCPKVSLGLGGLELDGLVLADGCAALIEVGAVLNEHTMAQLQRRLVVAGGPDAPAELRGLRLVGVLAGGVVRPDYTDVHSAQELAEEWAAAGVALLLPNAMGGLDFGDECLKSAPLLWPRPDG